MIVDLQSVNNLHQYLVRQHWNGQGLVGPDPGIRFNYRIGRFIKSGLRFVPWSDAYYYLQAQGYWILANWYLYRLTGREEYAQLAICASDTVLNRQRADGGWDYPNPEWRGRTANAEGTWASIGLLKSYELTSESRYLGGARRWHAYLNTKIGYQSTGDEVAVNYFAGQSGGRVANNTAFVLRFLAELAAVTGDQGVRRLCPGLLTFLERVQKLSGEFPYSVPGDGSDPGKDHFQCYQYNAFECLDLIRYYRLTGDKRAYDLVSNLFRFLHQGIAEDGHACYECGNPYRRVLYHTAALGAAFAEAGRLGIPDPDCLVKRAFRYLLDQQQPDGRFSYSAGDYHLLADRRSYPRYLAMILYHLLLQIPVDPGTVPPIARVQER